MDISNWAHYAKAIAAAGAALVATAAAISDGKVDGSELVTVLSAWGGVWAVWGLKNQPKVN